jgi:hypothetical protein
LNASAQQVADTARQLNQVAEALAEAAQQFQLQEGRAGHGCRAVPEKNRLFISLRGCMNTAEVSLAREAILKHAKSLRSGFGIVSDIGSFVATSEEGRQELQDIMKGLKALGVGQVVRVVPECAKVGAKVLQRISQATGYTAQEAPTEAEAERLLEQLERQTV